MPIRSRSTEVILLGVPELDATLKEFGQRVGNRIARASLRAGASVASKLIKQNIPHKTLKRLIGTSVKQEKKTSTVAKVGAAVGSARRVTPTRKGTKGVGMSSRNAHWFFMGTAKRYNVNQSAKQKAYREVRDSNGRVAVPKQEERAAVKLAKPRYTGFIKPEPAVKETVIGNLTNINSAIEAKARELLQKEAAKRATRK